MQNNNSPFDSKALIAVLVVAGFYVGWQSYLSKKYGTSITPVSAAASSLQTPNVEKKLNQNSGLIQNKNTDELVNIEPESFIVFENNKINLKISSLGMGIVDANLRKFINKDNQNVKVSNDINLRIFELKLNGQPINFNLTKKSDLSFIGTFENQDFKIERNLIFNDGYDFKSVVLITSKGDKLPKISLFVPDKIHKAESKSWFFPSYDHQDFNIVDGKESHLINFSNSKENISQQFNPVTLAGISSQYFTATLLDQSNLLPSVSIKSLNNEAEALLEIIYEPTQKADSYSFSQTGFIGPKILDDLTKVDSQFSQVVNFGLLGWLARPMLTLMKEFFEWTQNWGFAIIMLTLLVRLLVLPFNIISYKSMKGMQKIQPLIAQLKEKYKNDAMTLNREMMALMKTHNANPLSGCLPMLLQIPVFFALFRVIGSSVELYRSPFIFWISDLSTRDPYFVLPIIMGITMYFQQKLTPTTMDPVQAKVLSFMPLIFTAFMLNLPSGLTLYMCVSAIFGVTQQWYMLKKS